MWLFSGVPMWVFAPKPESGISLQASPHELHTLCRGAEYSWAQDQQSSMGPAWDGTKQACPSVMALGRGGSPIPASHNETHLHLGLDPGPDDIGLCAELFA